MFVLTTTVKGLDQQFALWCMHHLRLFDHIIVWLDDPKEIASHYLPKDTRILTRGGSQIHGSSPLNRLLLRQNANTDEALRLAAAMGARWLCHLDVDELLYPADRHLLESLNTDLAGQIRFLNHEAWPVWEAQNAFLECTTFKLNGKMTFNLYSNGKAMVRCQSSVHAKHAHEFAGFVGEDHQFDGMVVLHYGCPTYSAWLSKYRALGTFSDYWWDDPAQPITLTFHTASRDVVTRCMKEGRYDEAEQFFRSQLLTPDLRRALELEQKIADYRVELGI